MARGAEELPHIAGRQFDAPAINVPNRFIQDDGIAAGGLGVAGQNFQESLSGGAGIIANPTVFRQRAEDLEWPPRSALRPDLDTQRGAVLSAIAAGKGGQWRLVRLEIRAFVH